MPPERRCRGRKDDGSRCRAPSNLVDPESGFCPSHDPEAREKVREAARRGGEATARKRRAPGVQTRLQLDTYADAQEWLELVVRAVLSGKITDKQARAAIRGLEAWMKAKDEGEVTDRLDELTDALAEWKRTGDPSPVLEVVK